MISNNEHIFITYTVTTPYGYQNVCRFEAITTNTYCIKVVVGFGEFIFD